MDVALDIGNTVIKARPGLKKTAAYLRRSTDRQDQSIEDQKKACLEWAALHGYQIIAFYIDDAVSGTSTDDRDDFNRMIADALSPNPPFEAIIAYDIKRFSRGDPKEAAHHRYILQQNGVRVFYATENFKGDDTDELVWGVKQWLARKESKELSKVTFRGLISRAQGGWWNGGEPPYGYDLEYVNNDGKAFMKVRFNSDRTKLVLDLRADQSRLLPIGQRVVTSKSDRSRLVLSSPDRVALIRRIFRLYIHQGLGFRRIADVLNREGIQSPRGGHWSVGTIRAIIQNRIYVGDMVWNRRVCGRFHRVERERAIERDELEAGKLRLTDETDWLICEDAHKAIIDRATFLEAQRLLQQRRESRGADAYRHGRAMDSIFLLSGRMSCSRCGHSMTGETIWGSKVRKDGTRTKNVYYVCAGYKNKGNSVCRRSPIRVDVIHRFVLERISAQVDAILSNGGSEAVRNLLVRELAANQPDSKAERDQIQEDLGTIETKIDRLVDALASMDSANREIINKKMKTLVERRDSLRSRLKKLGPLQHKEVDCDAIADEIMASVRGFEDLFPHGTLEEQKEFIRLWVEKIELDPDKRVGKVYIKKFPLPARGNG